MEDVQYQTAMTTADFLTITLIALVAIIFIAVLLLSTSSPADICEMIEDEARREREKVENV